MPRRGLEAVVRRSQPLRGGQNSPSSAGLRVSGGRSPVKCGPAKLGRCLQLIAQVPSVRFRPSATSAPAEPAGLAALPAPPGVVGAPVTAGDSAATPLRRRSRLRQTQVHLDDRADGHLTALKKRAVMAEVDLSASAVLRQALSEYVERHGYDGVVAWFAEHGR